MKYFKVLLLTLLMPLTLLSCKSEDPEVVYNDYTPVYRWMDRQIYFAYSNGTNATRNNEFQKQAVQDSLREIEKMTKLGENYFTFTEVDEALLQPVYTVGESETQYRTFILIWPDADYNNFVVNTLGGLVPDQNGVTIVNSAFKQKFYMIFKASCFTSGSECNSITSNGVRALVARQLGSLVGMPMIQDCSSPALAMSTMCSSVPSNDQWNDLMKGQWAASFDNSLETILNTPTYYNPITPSN